MDALETLAWTGDVSCSLMGRSTDKLGFAAGSENATCLLTGNVGNPSKGKLKDTLWDPAGKERFWEKKSGWEMERKCELGCKRDRGGAWKD